VFAKSALFLAAAGIVFATSGVLKAGEIPDVHCPTAREWETTIDPQNRPLFQEFSETVIWNAERDFVGEGGLDYMRMAFFLWVHSYQNDAEYQEVLLPFLEALQQSPHAEKIISKDALSDMAKCASGDADIDCAEMAFQKGHIQSLHEYSKMNSFKKYLGFFEDACKIYARDDE